MLEPWLGSRVRHQRVVLSYILRLIDDSSKKTCQQFMGVVIQRKMVDAIKGLVKRPMGRHWVELSVRCWLIFFCIIHLINRSRSIIHRSSGAGTLMMACFIVAVKFKPKNCWISYKSDLKAAGLDTLAGAANQQWPLLPAKSIKH